MSTPSLFQSVVITIIPDDDLAQVPETQDPFSKDMLMPLNDLLYKKIFTERYRIIKEIELSEIVEKAKRFLPCTELHCSCDGWLPGGPMPPEEENWIHSLCNNSQCGHLLINHGPVTFISEEVIHMGLFAFDLINIRGTLNNETVKEEKNATLLRVLDNIYAKLLNKLRSFDFFSLKVIELCEAPPFTKRSIQHIWKNFGCLNRFGDDKSRSIQQILINFCMCAFGKNKSPKHSPRFTENLGIYFDLWRRAGAQTERMSNTHFKMSPCLYKRLILLKSPSRRLHDLLFIQELEVAFMITKFLIRFYDTWIWTCPEKLPKNTMREWDQSNSYEFYYERYLIFCFLPVCIQTIRKRHKMTQIFGIDVLRYTFKSFRTQLQDWCKAESVLWTERTKFICLERLPLYMDLLENEVYDFRSPIWRFDYKEADFRKKF